MVLGTAQKSSVCHYCGKQGHYKRDCSKFLADHGMSRGGRTGSNRGGRGAGRQGGAGRNGGAGRQGGAGWRGGSSWQNAGRNNGGTRHMGSLHMAQGGDDMEMQEVIRLGTAAYQNQQNQRANTTTTNTNQGKSVSFASGAEDSSGNFRPTKN